MIKKYLLYKLATEASLYIKLYNIFEKLESSSMLATIYILYSKIQIYLLKSMQNDIDAISQIHSSNMNID